MESQQISRPINRRPLDTGTVAPDNRCQLTDEELAGLEFVRAYIEGQNESFSAAMAEVSTLRAAAAASKAEIADLRAKIALLTGNADALAPRGNPIGRARFFRDDGLTYALSSDIEMAMDQLMSEMKSGTSTGFLRTTKEGCSAVLRAEPGKSQVFLDSARDWLASNT